jgi:hypothetical protein
MAIRSVSGLASELSLFAELLFGSAEEQPVMAVTSIVEISAIIHFFIS